MNLEALEIRAMLSGHPLILPTSHTSAFVASETSFTAAAVATPASATITSSSTGSSGSSSNDGNLADSVDGPLAKGGAQLVDLYQQYLASQQPGAVSSLASVLSSSEYSDLQFSGSSIALEMIDSGSESLTSFVSSLQALGVQTTDVSQTYDAVDAWTPLASLASIAELSAVQTMNPSLKPFVKATYDPGAGGPPMNVSYLTNLGITGAGVKVGVLSDSINNDGGETTGEQDGYLPTGANAVQVLQDGVGGTDEGAAMLEEIHALAPGSSLAFITSGDTQMQFANNITALADTGAKILTDDVGFLDEPFFEPSVADDAIGTAVSSGDIYFSAAGNAGSAGFESASDWVSQGGNLFFNWNQGSSATNAATTLDFTANVDGGTWLTFEWSNPWNGVTGNVSSNVQINVYDVTAQQWLIQDGIPADPQQNNNTFMTGEPVQEVFLPDNGEYQISAEVNDSVYNASTNPTGGLLTAGTALPQAVEFVTQDVGAAGATARLPGQSVEAPGIPVTTYGHAAGPNTIGIGAVDSANPSVSEYFSSLGPATYYFDANGNALPTHETIVNPWVSAPDDIPEDVNYPEFDPFFGTSAATANAAAVGALLMSKFPSLSQVELKNVFESTSTPIDGQQSGVWEPQPGYGLINAEAAYIDLSATVTAPEMQVQGDGTTIAYNEMSPSTFNATDFGSTNDAGGTISETYTITDVGTGTLDLSTLSIMPTSAMTGFSVTQNFTSTTLTQGQIAEFTITFTPTTVGTATATVSIGSNDQLNPTPFIFEITGSGTAPVPTMDVQGAGQLILYGESNPSPLNDTYFGSTYANGGSLSETFTILNGSSTLPLTVNSVSINSTSTVTGFTITSGSGAVTLGPNGSTTFTIVFSPTSAGLATAEVSIASDDQSNPTPFVFEVSALALAPYSAMQVVGPTNQTINDGAPPVAGNGTEFGAVLDNGASLSETFTIESTGAEANLDIQSITAVPVAGSAISGFSVSAPGSTTVAPGDSTTFTVTFAPNGPGVALADIEITSSDSSHSNPFIFEVTGTGYNPPPKIVSQLDDSNPTSVSLTGSWTTYSAGLDGSEHYTSAGAGTSQADYTFTGLTPGQYEILSTWAPISGAASNTSYTFYDGGTPVGGAVVNQSISPNGTVVTGWQVLRLVNITSTTLRVDITNNAGGTVLADGVEIGPLPGITLKYPSLTVSDNLTAVAANATPETANGTDFGSTAVGFGSAVRTFTITNNGLATLTFTGKSPIVATGSEFTIVSQPSVSSLAPGASTTFQVKFSPTATGLQSGAITIASNDPNFTSGFEMYLQGTGVTPTILNDTQATFAGTWATGTVGYAGNDHTAAAGTGSSTATWTFSGLAAGQYQVYATWPTGTGEASNAPYTLYNGTTAVGTLAVNQKNSPSGISYSGSTFQLLGTVTVTGTSLKVVLTNNANGTVAADAIAIVPTTSSTVAAAQIGVTGDGAAIAKNATPSTTNGTNFGGATVNTGSVTDTFTISNTGGSTLTLTGATPITVSGSGFSLVAQPAVDSLAPGASVTFQVKFAPTSSGSLTGTISIASSDPTNPTYTIDVAGTGVAANSPKIGITGNSTAIAAGGTPQIANDTDFGSVTEPTSSVIETYTITNNGQSTLTLTAPTPVSVTGADFSIVSQPASDSLASGASTTFQIKFTPTATGAQTGTVTVKSNDPTNGTYTFNVQGTGLPSATGTPTIIDDSQTGFSLVGSWSTTKIGGYDGGEHYTAGGTGNAQAVYSFTGLTAGTYLVYATWSTINAPSTPASNALYTLYNGATSVGTATLNQKLSPSGASFSSTAFEYVGAVNLTSSLLRVILSNNANGAVYADAIAVVRMPTGDLSITKTDNVGGSSIANTTGTAVPGDAITYTIQVSNSGPGAAINATVTDLIPGGIASDTYTIATTGGAVDVTHGTSGSGSILDTVDIPSGGTITYTVNATVSPSATGTLSNTATVTPPSTFYDANLANNTATDTDNLKPTVALNISKTDSGGGSSLTHTTGAALPGGDLTYTIVVSNAGPSTAVGATVADALASITDLSSDTYTAVGTSGASGFSASGSGSIDDTVNLASGSSITYTVVAVISGAATGTMTNTATLTAGSGETVASGSVLSATDTDTLVPTVELTITKTDSDGGSSVTNTTGVAAPGSVITYTITVTNVGPSNAVNAIVADPLASNTDYTSDTFTAAASGAASGFTASGSGSIDDIVDISAGSSITYTVTADIASTATGTLSNYATVAAGSADTLAAGSVTTATDNDTLATLLVMTITKTDNDGGSSITNSTGFAPPGSQIIYTITVSNTGATNATNAIIADPLGSNADFTSDTFTAVASGAASGFTASGSGSIDDIVDMSAGSTITYTVMADISGAATGTLSNFATIAAGNSQKFGTGSISTATDNDTLASPLVTITKVDSDGGSSVTNTTGAAVPGSQITYTITVTNSGPSSEVGATVADALAANPDYTSDSFTAAGTAGASGFTASGTGSISDTVTLASGSSITYTVVADISSSATGTLTNVATVTPPMGESFSMGSVGTATDNDTLTSPVVLQISKSDNDGGSSVNGTVGQTAPGATITYTITVTNFGPGAAVGATVADPLASNTNLTSDMFTAVGSSGASGFTASGTGSIDDTVDLAAGSTITYTVVADISNAASGTLSNTATVAAGAGETLGSGSITTATDTDALGPGVVLTVAKTDSDGGSSTTSTVGSASPGSQITYTIVVSNSGATSATGVAVADPLASNTNFQSDTFTAVGTTGASGFTASGSGSISDTVDLAAGSSITYTVVGVIKAGATGTLSNTATITPGAGETLGGGSNTTATDTDTLAPTVILQIQKSDNDGGSSANSTTGAAAPGSQIIYTIVVTNYGPSNAVGASVADSFASNPDITSDTFTAAGTAGATGFTATGSGSILDTVNLAAGSSITYTITANISGAASGTLSNTTTVGAGSGETLGSGSITTATDSDTLS